MLMRRYRRGRRTQLWTCRVQLIQDSYREGESIGRAGGDVWGRSQDRVYGWSAMTPRGGRAGNNRSRMPKQIPGRVSEEVVACIVAARVIAGTGGRAELRVKLAAAAGIQGWCGRPKAPSAKC